MAEAANPMQMVRWLAIPALLGGLALVGMAISTESRADFERRTQQEAARESDGAQPGDQLDQNGGQSPSQNQSSPSDDRSSSERQEQGSNEADGSTVSGAPDEGGQPIIILTPNGEVVVQFGPDGDVLRLTPVSSPAGPEAASVEVDPADLAAIRVGEDGTLEVVPLDQVGQNDTVLVPTEDGLDLVRPDGSRVEFRADGENDGVTATEISPTGQETELAPNQDGSVQLSDGTIVGPIDVAEDGGAMERLLDSTTDLPWPWVLGAITLLVILSLGIAAYLHKTRPDDTLDYSQFAEIGVDVEEFDQFIAVLRADADPSRAIRLGFYAAERGLAGLPARRQNETPFEWHNRVGQDRPDLAEPLGPICDRFAMVRFAPGQATTADRDAVVDHLLELNQVGDGSPARQKTSLAGV